MPILLSLLLGWIAWDIALGGDLHIGNFSWGKAIGMGFSSGLATVLHKPPFRIATGLIGAAAFIAAGASYGLYRWARDAAKKASQASTSPTP
jgi:hypothetical protein